MTTGRQAGGSFETRTYRFGPYEFDTRSRLLRKAGVRLRLQGKPGLLLEMLLDKAGEVVTREELHQKLWPPGHYVEFETGLNTAVKKLRQLLNDDPNHPRYIQTVPKVGYRFVGRAEMLRTADSAAPSPPAKVQSEGSPSPNTERQQGQLPAGRERRLWPWAVAALAVAVAAAVIAYQAVLAPRPEPRKTARLQLTLPDGKRLAYATGRGIDISRDGEYIVYAASAGSKRRLFLRKLDAKRDEEIPETENAYSPFFSPDGSSIGYFVGDEVRLIRRTGEPLQRIALPQSRGAMSGLWLEDGTVVLSGTSEGSGGTRIPGIFLFRRGKLAKAPRKGIESPDVWHFPMCELPGSRVILSSVVRGPVDRDVEWLDLETGDHGIVQRKVSGGHCTTSGHLLTYQNASLMATVFDPTARRAIGGPTELETGLRMAGWLGGDMAISRTGTLVFVPSLSLPDRQLTWVDWRGRETPLPIAPGPFEFLDLDSADRKLLLARWSAQRKNWSIWVTDLATSQSEELITNLEDIPRARWIDSQQYVYTRMSGPESLPKLYLRKLGPDASEVRLPNTPIGNLPSQWHPGRRTLLITVGLDTRTATDLAEVDLNPGGQPRFLLAAPEMDSLPALSPDGRWLAYQRESSGQRMAMVRNLEGGEPVVVPVADASAPAWHPSGNRLLMIANGRLTQIAFRPERRPPWGPPTRIGEGVYLPASRYDRNLHITSTGDRILVVKDIASHGAPQPIVVVVNWLEELKEKVPPPRR